MFELGNKKLNWFLARKLSQNLPFKLWSSDKSPCLGSLLIFFFLSFLLRGFISMDSKVFFFRTYFSKFLDFFRFLPPKNVRHFTFFSFAWERSSISFYTIKTVEMILMKYMEAWEVLTKFSCRFYKMFFISNIVSLNFNFYYWRLDLAVVEKIKLTFNPGLFYLLIVLIFKFGILKTFWNVKKIIKILQITSQWNVFFFEKFANLFYKTRPIFLEII